MNNQNSLIVIAVVAAVGFVLLINWLFNRKPVVPTAIDVFLGDPVRVYVVCAYAFDGFHPFSVLPGGEVNQFVTQDLAEAWIKSYMERNDSIAMLYVVSAITRNPCKP